MSLLSKNNGVEVTEDNVQSFPFDNHWCHLPHVPVQKSTWRPNQVFFNTFSETTQEGGGGAYRKQPSSVYPSILQPTLDRLLSPVPSSARPPVHGVRGQGALTLSLPPPYSSTSTQHVQNTLRAGRKFHQLSHLCCSLYEHNNRKPSTDSLTEAYSDFERHRHHSPESGSHHLEPPSDA